MKYLIIIVFIFNTIPHGFSQSVFSSVDNIEIGGKTYICNNGRSKLTIVYDENNPSINWDYAADPPAPIGCGEMSPLIRVNRSLITNTINNIFSPERKAELYANFKGLRVQLYINPSTGEIVDVYFYIGHTNIITPTEVYELDQALKGLMMPPSPTCSPKSYIVCSYSIRWGEI